MTLTALPNTAAHHVEAPPIAVMPTSDDPAALQPALTDLPDELLEHIARRLPAKDVLALVAASPARFLPALENQRNLAIAQRDVTGLASFKNALNAIRRLRQMQQIDLLERVGQRLSELRPNDQRTGQPLFNDAVTALPDKVRPQRLVDLARILKHGSSHAACMAGENVTVVGKLLKLDVEQIWALEDAVIQGPAKDAVRAAGATVGEVAQRLGVGSTPERVLALEMHLVDGPAGAEVAAGASVPEVSQRYGISSRRALACLELTAARSNRAPRLPPSDQP